ncbi:unnamed protein product [Caenorhabditis sp. 36 PRJEB53466]|nr:unnamed protein product [Caenorhabditis sp. 36 PRJEB53466]
MMTSEDLNKLLQSTTPPNFTTSSSSGLPRPDRCRSVPPTEVCKPIIDGKQNGDTVFLKTDHGSVIYKNEIAALAQQKLREKNEQMFRKPYPPGSDTSATAIEFSTSLPLIHQRALSASPQMNSMPHLYSNPTQTSEEELAQIFRIPHLPFQPSLAKRTAEQAAANQQCYQSLLKLLYDPYSPDVISDLLDAMHNHKSSSSQEVLQSPSPLPQFVPTSSKPYPTIRTAPIKVIVHSGLPVVQNEELKATSSRERTSEQEQGVVPLLLMSTEEDTSAPPLKKPRGLLSEVNMDHEFIEMLDNIRMDAASLNRNIELAMSNTSKILAASQVFIQKMTQESVSFEKKFSITEIHTNTSTKRAAEPIGSTICKRPLLEH